MFKNPTNAQRVASAQNEWSAHVPRIQRAQPANGSGHVTVRLVLYAVTSSEVVLVDTISRNLRHHP